MDNSMCKINQRLVYVKCFYFIAYAAVGCLIPFIPLYMRALGFSKQLAGTVLGVIPFVAFISQPVFGFLADKMNKHRLVVFLCCITSGLTYNVLPFLSISYTEYTPVESYIILNSSNTYFLDRLNLQEHNDEMCPMPFRSYMDRYINSQLSTDNINTSVKKPIYFPTESHCVGHCENGCYHTSATSFDAVIDVDYGVNCSDSLFDNDLLLSEYFYLMKPKSEIQSEPIKLHDISIDLNDVQKHDLITLSTIVSNDVVLFSKCKFKCPKINTCYKREMKESSYFLRGLQVALLILGYVTYACSMNILDATTFQILGPENRYQFGKQRLWGNIGLALIAVLSGYLMDTSSADISPEQFRISFYGYGAFISILGIALLTVAPRNTKPSEKDFTGVCLLCKDVEILIFLVVVLYLGCVNGTIGGFLFWFIEEELRTKHRVIPGLCIFFNCLSEIFMFYFSSTFLKRFGHLKCIYVSILASSIRFGCYSVIQDAWFILPVELLNGMTFSLLWSAATTHGSSVAPKSLSGTIQGVLHGVFNGLGKGLGCIITGQLYPVIGIRWYFRSCAILSFLVLCIYLIFNCNNTKNSDKRGTVIKPSTDQEQPSVIKNDSNTEDPSEDKSFL